jgi:RNA polymerase sigma factor (sigma-70 family)
MNWFNNSKKSDKATDEVLLRRYRQSGDLAVLAELFEGYSSMVYFVCFKYLQDGEQSKDAVMQIFEELITKVNKQEINQFGSWLYVLSRNYCLMQLRASKKMEYTTIDNFMELPVELHQDVEAKEKQLTALELCMEKLPRVQKQSIDLFFMNEKCYKEITEITGYSLNDVKSYIQNGKRNLKICMEKNGER